MESILMAMPMVKIKKTRPLSLLSPLSCLEANVKKKGHGSVELYCYAAMLPHTKMCLRKLVAQLMLELKM